MCWTAETKDDNLATTIRREMVRYLEERVHERESLPEAEIVVGELIGNAFRHSPGPMCADVLWRDGTRPAVVVHDAGECFPEARLPRPNFSSESGRGLLIVRALTHRLSVRPVKPRGCMVTATLRLSRRADASADPHPCARGTARTEIGCACAMLVHGIDVSQTIAARTPQGGA
ncbi:MAG: ATP-binding protein [Candidatus Baltobacteraceae bacterium]